MKEFVARCSDGVLCALLNTVHRMGRGGDASRDALETYIERWSASTVADYFGFEPPGSALEGFDFSRRVHRWPGPAGEGFHLGDHAAIEYFPGPFGADRPTLILLHALMSVSATGYRRLAVQFNRWGWNVCFVHLPFHYSRRPRGYMNGELCISADLVRTAEGLRRAVQELRQLLWMLRRAGCSEFGLLGTSYGAWIGSLLAAVESGWRFVSLVTPVECSSKIIWEGPATVGLRGRLREAGISPELVARHERLVSPRRVTPLGDPARISLFAGEQDQICPLAGVRRLSEAMGGARCYSGVQGHFGHRLLAMAVEQLQADRVTGVDASC